MDDLIHPSIHRRINRGERETGRAPTGTPHTAYRTPHTAHDAYELLLILSGHELRPRRVLLFFRIMCLLTHSLCFRIVPDFIQLHARQSPVILQRRPTFILHVQRSPPLPLLRTKDSVANARYSSPRHQFRSFGTSRGAAYSLARVCHLHLARCGRRAGRREWHTPSPAPRLP